LADWLLKGDAEGFEFEVGAEFAIVVLWTWWWLWIKIDIEVIIGLWWKIMKVIWWVWWFGVSGVGFAHGLVLFGDYCRLSA
jgi:hypothetical protein